MWIGQPRDISLKHQRETRKAAKMAKTRHKNWLKPQATQAQYESTCGYVFSKWPSLYRICMGTQVIEKAYFIENSCKYLSCRIYFPELPYKSFIMTAILKITQPLVLSYWAWAACAKNSDSGEEKLAQNSKYCDRGVAGANTRGFRVPS